MPCNGATIREIQKIWTNPKTITNKYFSFLLCSEKFPACLRRKIGVKNCDWSDAPNFIQLISAPASGMSPASSFGDKRKDCGRANCSLICFLGRIAAPICQIALSSNLFCLAKNGTRTKRIGKRLYNVCVCMYSYTFCVINWFATS